MNARVHKRKYSARDRKKIRREKTEPTRSVEISNIKVRGRGNSARSNANHNHEKKRKANRYEDSKRGIMPQGNRQ